MGKPVRVGIAEQLAEIGVGQGEGFLLEAEEAPQSVGSFAIVAGRELGGVSPDRHRRHSGTIGDLDDSYRLTCA